jgi:transposase
LFDYQQTRAAENPRRFLLSGFTGYLHVDDYAGYEGLPGVELVGFWAHARHKFEEAAKALPPSSSPSLKRAVLEGLGFCQVLFRIEEAPKELMPEQRHAARQERSRPIVETFRQ